jgi:hypothetical protein
MKKPAMGGLPSCFGGELYQYFRLTLSTHVL